MNQEIAQRWASELESGKYLQGIGALHRRSANGEDSYCCLGVLCSMAAEEGMVAVTPGESGRIVYDGNSGYLPDSVMAWADMRSFEGSFGFGEEYNLSHLNDGGVPFREIANIIREKQEEL